jgi:hypothetical protein
MKSLLLAAAAALLLGASPVVAEPWVINGNHVDIDAGVINACVQGMENFDASQNQATNRGQNIKQCALMIYHSERGEPIQR